MDRPAAFINSGGEAGTPLLMTAPHCGRHYPESLLRMSRLPVEFLRKLEDPYVDLLLRPAVAAGHELIAATHARAWIDLNRGEHDIDAAMIETRDKVLAEPSMRARSGLGLFPRVVGNQHLLRRKMSALEVSERVTHAHRPYHKLIRERLAARCARHGIALVLDCHSMPSLPVTPQDPRPPAIILGDLHGQAASPWVIACADDHFTSLGFLVRRNRPYAGGHTLQRHATPHRGIHALQVEVDRALYMDVGTHQPHDGVARIGEAMAGLADMLCRELALRGRNDESIAAE